MNINIGMECEWTAGPDANTRHYWQISIRNISYVTDLWVLEKLF